MNKKITLRKANRNGKLVSQIVYSKQIARGYHDIRYFQSMQSYINNLPDKEKEKFKYSTPKSLHTQLLIKHYKTLLEERTRGVFAALSGIYNKNKRAAEEGLLTRKNTNLMYLVSSIPMLVTAYRKIRGNKGAMTLGYTLSDMSYNKLSPIQRTFINKTLKAPDGISKSIFVMVSKLLRKGQYPWGTSRRIYVPKPGRPGKFRPVTIPPFMDRVVQASISMVLEAIYEPYFMKKDCSHGFRPRVGVHNAIYKLSGWNARGLHTAIEGDISGAFNNVRIDKLIEILSEKICDKKFLDLIRNRMEYWLFDTEKNKYEQSTIGTQQGGIDSPYLWNIYMDKFDDFVLKETDTLLWEQNDKVIRGRSNNKKTLEGQLTLDPTKRRAAKTQPPIRKNYERQRKTLMFIVSLINKYKNDHKTIDETIKNKKAGELAYKKELYELYLKRAISNKTDLKLVKYTIIRRIRQINHKLRSIPSFDKTKTPLRFIYERYADDWILITNAPTHIVERLRQMYKEYLKDELGLELAMDKTNITDFRKEPARFLGFEIKTPQNSKFTRTQRIINNKSKRIISKTGSYIITLPDKQRLINRFHMKGYCDKKGFPREIPWLSHLEPHIIIERYNAVIRGLCNYYTEFIKGPQKQLSRWVYILRYSCFKTLAQKYKSSIKKIMNKFKLINQNGKYKERTIEVKVNLNINGKQYIKKWQLLTLNTAIVEAKQIKRFWYVVNYHKTIKSNLTENAQEEYLEQVSMKNKTKFPIITDEDYLDKVKWVNLRTQALFDFPCCICGSTEKVEMHHLKHIRKRKYELIPETRFWEKVMALRNRKSIPVCRECHINLIHKGKYGGTKLRYLAPISMYDNNIVMIDAFINKGNKEPHEFTKTLEEKGWVNVIPQAEKENNK